MEFILDPDNCLPLTVDEKERFLNFEVVCMEMTWLLRNRLVHGEQQQD